MASYQCKATLLAEFGKDQLQDLLSKYKYMQEYFNFLFSLAHNDFTTFINILESKYSYEKIKIVDRNLIKYNAIHFSFYLKYDEKFNKVELNNILNINYYDQERKVVYENVPYEEIEQYAKPLKMPNINYDTLLSNYHTLAQEIENYNKLLYEQLTSFQYYKEGSIACIPFKNKHELEKTLKEISKDYNLIYNSDILNYFLTHIKYQYNIDLKKTKVKELNQEK